MLKFEVEVKLKGRCKHCGKTFYLGKSFSNHLAYEHGIYKFKIYKLKAITRNTAKKYFKLK